MCFVAFGSNKEGVEKMSYTLRLGETYRLAETDEKILITVMHGFDADRARYYLLRKDGKPHCYEFRDFEFNLLGTELKINDGAEVLLQSGQKELADKVLSSRGL